MSASNRSYKLATVGGSLSEEVEEAEEGEQPPVMRRRRDRMFGGGINSLKRLAKHHKLSGRRISCADLGVGAHQGWLYTRKPRKSKWEKCSKWCVVKETDLFVYEDQRDKVANSRIYLPAFRVTDANKETKQKGAFKIANEGTTFFFRCKTDEEKYLWMNHLSLVVIDYPMEKIGSWEPTPTTSRSTGSSSGIDVRSIDSSRTSAYSDADETDDTYDDNLGGGIEVAIRPKKPSINPPPGRLKSHIDTNDALRKLVTSIREADLDFVGVDRATRRQSQLRKSLAQAGFSRKNSSKNKKVFMLRAKERQKQALEHELSDIEDLLGELNRKNLYEFLSRYPEYEDGLDLDLELSLSPETCSEPVESAAHIDNELGGASGTCGAYGGFNGVSQMPPVCTRTGGKGSRSKRDTLLEPDFGDRQTLTPDSENFRLDNPASDGDLNDNHSLLDRPSSYPPDRPSSNSAIFQNQKYKQTITEL